MNNCIFTSHCTESVCDKSCPILAETSYLLERNNISIDSALFKTPPQDIEKACSILHKAAESLDKFMVVVGNNTISSSNILTYCAICENWQGNRLHCNVYHLKFSNYVEAIQKSWSSKTNSDSLEYEQIWCSTAKILIISSLDFVQFKDFQSQTLLNIIHNRMNNGLVTIIVSPKPSSLMGDGRSQFFSRMVSMFNKKGACIEWQ